VRKFRIALIRNFHSIVEWGSFNIGSFKNLIQNILPSAQIHVYAPISGDGFPDVFAYDLIILSGGPQSLLLESQPSWVEETFAFIRAFSESSTNAKLLGICWGHLAICRAFGGSLTERQCVRPHRNISESF